MKKQQGFTLIELMVVMAIIAILATAGLSAYTGYIKKARDAVRMADINAINKIVIGSMSVNGMPPQSSDGLYDILTDMNNGVAIADPLSS
jgi:prepilin-type N-terminal cleavage/methylation domain-containing protein